MFKSSQFVSSLLIALFVATEHEKEEILREADFELSKLPLSIEKVTLLRLRKIVGQRQEKLTARGFLQGDALFVCDCFNIFCKMTPSKYACPGQVQIDSFRKNALFSAIFAVFGDWQRSEEFAQLAEKFNIFKTEEWIKLSLQDVTKAKNADELRLCGWGEFCRSKARGYCRVSESGSNLQYHTAKTSIRRGLISVDSHFSGSTRYFDKIYFAVDTYRFSAFRSAQIQNINGCNFAEMLKTARNLINETLRLVIDNAE